MSHIFNIRLAKSLGATLLMALLINGVIASCHLAVHGEHLVYVLFGIATAPVNGIGVVMGARLAWRLHREYVDGP